jgi:hypothetical protein
MTDHRTKEAALEAFIERKAEFDRLIERLAEASEEHFDFPADEINWGHVGTLSDWVKDLRRIADAAFHEGEHAA